MTAPTIADFTDTQDAVFDLIYRLRFAEFVVAMSAASTRPWDDCTLGGFSRFLGDCASQAEAIHEAVSAEVEEARKVAAAEGGVR